MRREITLTCPGSGSPGARLRCWRMRSVNLYMTRAQDLEVNVAFGKEIVLKNVKLKESALRDAGVPLRWWHIYYYTESRQNNKKMKD